MADAAVAAPAAAAGQPQQQPQQRPKLMATLLRLGVFWFFMTWMRGKSPQQVTKQPENFLVAKYKAGQPFDVHVYLTEAGFIDLDAVPEPVWVLENIKLAEPNFDRNVTIEYTPSDYIKNNGTAYLHAVFAEAGYPLSPAALDGGMLFVKTHPITRYLPKRKNATGTNLLEKKEDKEVKKEEDTLTNTTRPILNYWKTNLTIAMVDHFSTYNKKEIPAPVASFIEPTSDNQYLPVVFFNEFWLLRDKLIEVNRTVATLPLTLSINTISAMWWQLLLQFEQSFQLQVNTGLTQDGESDEMKRIFLEGNPILLAVTVVVSLLHSVFDFLAFKNDIGFWKNNKSMEGLSARSIVINAACQFVIMLYLFDSETSYVVLLSSAVGTLIEFWKVTKAMEVKVLQQFPFISVKSRDSYMKNDTNKYDEEATRYLSYVLYPLVIGYSVYTLMYKEHKSWYSWILTSLVGAVYMFGFILMCPQLYLNYKLKSVAHLPWRQMTYKFLNTIIDDLFAFVIKMPTLHRLSVFRDDLVFLVYIYQRWIYRVDKSRVNEFGWVPEQEAAAAAEPTPEALPAAETKSAGEDDDTSLRQRRKEGAAQTSSNDSAEPAAESKKDS